MIATLIIVNLMMGIVVDLVVSLQSASEKELWFDSAKALTDKCVALRCVAKLSMHTHAFETPALRCCVTFVENCVTKVLSDDFPLKRPS